jgi:hypothetical protein
MAGSLAHRAAGGTGCCLWIAAALMGCGLRAGGMSVDVDPGAATPPLRGDVGCRYDSFDCNPAVDDVPGQIATLPSQGAVLGFHRGPMAALTWSRHWQGIQRLTGAHANHLILTRSTSRPSDADMGVVRLGSRLTDGRVVRNVHSRTEHTHAGGAQLLGKVLAVPLEENAPGSRVELYDLSDPEDPSPIGLVEHTVAAGRSVADAGTASFARLADRRFLLVIGRRDARTLDFYLSTTADLRATGWAFVASWSHHDLRTAIGDATFGAYQSLQLVVGADGRLYLVGMHEDGLVFPAQWVDVFLVEGARAFTITKLAKRRLECGGACSLDAGAGVYVDPKGVLVVYAVERTSHGADRVTVKEFRAPAPGELAGLRK